jgi:hypothetical protein
MKQLAIIVAGFLFTCLLFTNTSCHKKTDCIAKIDTVDSLGNPWSGANVQLYAVVKTGTDALHTGTVIADVKANGTTDGDGKAQFTFKLPAIYDIKATATVGSKTYVGTGIIKLEEGQTTEQSVTLH